MAKLIQCKDCGHQIAKSAKSCPHCGAKNKKPFYYNWLFWLIIVVFVLGMIPADDSDLMDNSPEHSTENHKIDSGSEEPLSFELIAGVAGKYGELFTLNYGTEFEETYYIYRIPTGNYTVTNIGEYASQISVYSDKFKTNNDGLQEPEETIYVKLFDIEESDIVYIPDGCYVEIHKPSRFYFSKIVDGLTESDKHKDEKRSFSIGERVELNNVLVTLIDVYESAGKDFFEPTEGNVFVICEFEIENKTSGDISVSSFLSFEAYFDGYAANIDISAITLSEKTQLDGTIAAGKKMRGVVGYQAPSDWENVELQFSPSFWSSKKMIFTYNK